MYMEDRNVWTVYGWYTERCPKVSFLEDRDGQPWTWVMGEHPDDKNIEQILQEEAQGIARQQAELEAEHLRYRERLSVYIVDQKTYMYRVAQKSKLLYCDRYFNG